MLNKLRVGSFFILGLGIALAAGCNQNRVDFPEGSTLTIKCLKDVVAYYDDPMEGIVGEFEKDYPNVKINLDLQDTTSENIKELNEALKRGEGPDVVIGNDLPFRTYAEKGYLLDITNCVESVEKEKEIKFFDQMKNSFAINGKIYAEPCGFKLYAVQGSKKVIEASKSPQELVKQMLNEYLLHPEMKVRANDVDFSGTVYPIEIRECWNVLYEVSADKIYFDNYQINLNEMEVLFRSIKELTKATFGNDPDVENLNLGTTGGMNNQIGYVIAEYYPTALDQVWQRQDIFAMHGYRDWKGKKFALLENADGSPYYSTCSVLGITVNNKDKELAEEFVKYVLTYQESQEYLSLARDYMKSNLKGTFIMDGVKAYHSKEGEGYIMTPEVEILKKDQELLLKQMDSAVLIKNEDGAIKRIVTKYVQEYINNNMSLEEAIEFTRNDINDYLLSF